LNHPNLVRAYAIGEEDGIFFMAAERAEGVTLDKLLKQKKMVSAQEAVQVTLAVASVIDCAWNEQRLVLRNISPRNIAITGSGMVKVTNLRFARIAEDLEDLNEDLNIWDPQYCSSPESLNGTPMDVRSDIYGLGATFFHLVTGRLPFEGDTAFEIARKHLQEPVPDPRDLNPDLPESFTRIIQKMMAKDMKERYQDAAELIADIRLSRRQKETEKTDGAVSVKTQRIEKVERTLELRVPEHRERSEPLPAGRACFFAGSFEETVRADNLLHVPSGFRNQLLPGDELVLAMSKDNLLVMPGGNAFIPDLKEGGIPFEIVTIAPDYGFPVSLPEAPSFKMGQRVVFLGAVTHFMAMASKSGNQ
jgi:serine/threonine protein kinase